MAELADRQAASEDKLEQAEVAEGRHELEGDRSLAAEGFVSLEEPKAEGKSLQEVRTEGR